MPSEYNSPTIKNTVASDDGISKHRLPLARHPNGHQKRYQKRFKMLVNDQVYLTRLTRLIRSQARMLIHHQ
jgi:hypothetical protein